MITPILLLIASIILSLLLVLALIQLHGPLTMWLKVLCYLLDSEKPSTQPVANTESGLQGFG